MTVTGGVCVAGLGQEALVPDVIERFIKALVITAKAVVLYPPASHVPVQTAGDAVDALNRALRLSPVLTFSVTKDSLFFEGKPLFPGSKAYESFAEELYRRRLGDVRFHSGATASDLVAFLTVLRYAPGELEAMGGVEGRLWERGVASISVTRPETVVVDVETLEIAGGHEALARERIEAALAAAASGQGDAVTNEVLAEAARELGLETVCEILLTDFEESSVSHEGLARALRTIALVSTAGRDRVLGVALNGLRKAGASDGYLEAVSEAFSPQRLTESQGREDASTQASADALVHLMEFAGSGSVIIDGAGDPEFETLIAEARQGITDGDVIMALVSALVLSADELEAAGMGQVLDNALDYVVELGDVSLAADVAEALGQARLDPTRSPELHRQLDRAAAKLSHASGLRRVVQTLRLHEDGTPEHAAASRFIDALGPVAIKPLLEEMAEEPDMAVRRALVALLSGLAPGHEQEFSTQLKDPRWYVVRNVVSILGSTRSSAALPALTRTLRHAEPRVRRETIRGLAGIPDRRATELIVSALTDEDAQNVRLAARQLGMVGAREAVADLEEVARGDGRGNRDMGPRVEAIEALGRIGDPAALPTLDSLASKRGLLRAAKTGDVRSAAAAAAEQIRRAGGESFGRQ
jgi:hypothetical protein